MWDSVLLAFGSIFVALGLMYLDAVRRDRRDRLEYERELQARTERSIH